MSPPAIHASAPIVAPATTGMVVAAYTHRCVGPEHTPADILSRARADGWRDATGTSDDSQSVSDPSGAMTSRVTESGAGDERFITCGIETRSDLHDITDATSAMLGLQPAFRGKGAATFLALREQGAWKNPAGMDRAAFAAAKADGDVYSVMTREGAARSALFSLNIRPATAPN